MFFKCEDSSTIKQRFNQTPKRKKKNKKGFVLQKQDDVMSEGDIRNGILKEKSPLMEIMSEKSTK